MFKELIAGVKNAIFDNDGLLGHHLKHRYETALGVKPCFCSKLLLIWRHTLHNTRNSKVEIAFWAVERAYIHKQLINSQWSQNQNSELKRTRFTWTNVDIFSSSPNHKIDNAQMEEFFIWGFIRQLFLLFLDFFQQVFSLNILESVLLITQFKYSMFKGNTYNLFVATLQQ